VCFGLAFVLHFFISSVGKNEEEPKHRFNNRWESEQYLLAVAAPASSLGKLFVLGWGGELCLGLYKFLCHKKKLLSLKRLSQVNISSPLFI